MVFVVWCFNVFLAIVFVYDGLVLIAVAICICLIVFVMCLDLVFDFVLILFVCGWIVVCLLWYVSFCFWVVCLLGITVVMYL